MTGSPSSRLSSLPPLKMDKVEVKLGGKKIEYVCVVQTNDMLWLEQELHKKFSDKHRGNEWFELDEEEIKFMLNLSNKGIIKKYTSLKSIPSPKQKLKEKGFSGKVVVPTNTNRKAHARNYTTTPMP
jgi:hypothetical protein